MKKVIVILSICAIICGCKPKAPGCSDEETREAVIDLARKRLANDLMKAFWIPAAKVVMKDEVIFQIDGIRTTDINEKTGACVCAADLTVSIPKEMADEVNLKDEITYSIEYTSELTDKDDEFYVTLHEME